MEKRHTNTQRKNAIWQQRQRLELCRNKTSNDKVSSYHQKLVLWIKLYGPCLSSSSAEALCLGGGRLFSYSSLSWWITKLKLRWFNSVQFSHSVVSYSATPWTAACQASLSITNSRSLPKPMSIESVMLSNSLILCCPLLLLSSIFPSIRVFSNESTLRMRWPKYWSFSFSMIPSKEIPGLISFRMDWLDLLAVQGPLKSLLQHHSSKASILLHSAFFIVQLSHPYMTTGKTIALTRWTFVDKVMSLLFNMLSRLVITFLPRGKRLLIWDGHSSSFTQWPENGEGTKFTDQLLTPHGEMCLILKDKDKGKSCCSLVTKPCLTLLWPCGL